MMTKPLALAAIAYALTTAAADAATIDLASRGLTQGALIAESSTVDVVYDPTDPGFPDTGFVFIDDVYGGADFFGDIVVELTDPLASELNLFDPIFFSGLLVDYDIDATSAAGLFLDPFEGHVLALLTLPAGAAFSPNGFSISGATLQLYEANRAAVIPLPAAAPLLLAGLGALAVAARRRKG